MTNNHHTPNRIYDLRGLRTALVFVSLFIPRFGVGQLVNPPTLTVLHAFEGGTDGQYPEAGLIQDSLGNLYGATIGGGQPGGGTIFQVSPSGEETVLYSFGSQPGDGGQPAGPLLRDGAGNLYGTTLVGGSGFGTVFELANSGEERVLYYFGGGSDGANPRGGLVADSMDNLYGTTVQGGGTGCNSFGCGTVFKIAPDGHETILHGFTGSPDGANPEKGLIRDGAGNLYGTTFTGGAQNYGTVYKISSSGIEEVLYSFAGPPKGAYPWGTLVRDSAGNFYGTTLAGGTSTLCTPGCGTIFKLSASDEETVLHSFSGQADGSSPYGNLVRDKRGNFYGTTAGGGNSACGCGTVFGLSTSGRFITLHRFQGTADGSSPDDGVTLDNSGNLYGTTYYGGANNRGVVFKLIP